MKDLQAILDLEPAEFMRTIYRILLGREVEDGAIENCTQRIADGGDKIDILREVASSDEAISRAILIQEIESLSESELREAYRQVSYPSSIGHWLRFEGENFIRATYYVLLGRGPDPVGQAHYLNQLEKGTRKTRIIYLIAKSEESVKFKPAFPGLKNLIFREKLLSVPGIGDALKKIDLEFLSGTDPRPAGSVPQLGFTPKAEAAASSVELPESFGEALDRRFDKYAALLVSSERFNDYDASRDAIAVVSVRPLDLTGIAHFNRQTFVRGDVSVDFFADFNSLDDISSSHFLDDDEDCRYFHVDYLIQAAAKRKYKAIIFVLGNSDHNVPVAKAMRKLRRVKLNTLVYVHIHDAILLNICRKVVDWSGDNTETVMRELLVKRIGEEQAERVENLDEGSLVRHGVTGINYLIDGLHVDGILFNSEAARKLFMADLPNMSPDAMHVLFHPVFGAYARRSETSGAGEHVRMGTFGVPGGDKQTLDVCRAFDQFHQQYPDSSFVLAGFHVREFAEANNIRNGEGGYLIDEPETTGELLDLMSSCTFAIQLRLSNHGESSGVVPQLLSQDVPVIATEIGSFCVFGEAVRFVEPNISIEELLGVMLSEASAPVDRSLGREHFVTSHSPESFMGKLEAIVGADELRKFGEVNSTLEFGAKLGRIA